MSDGASRGYTRTIPAMVVAVLCLCLFMTSCQQTGAYESTVTGQWSEPRASSGSSGLFMATPTTKRGIVPSPDKPPPRADDCQGHFEACMASRLSRKRGGHWKHSVCQDCRDRCKAEDAWPNKTYDNKDCQWWNYPPKNKR